MHGLAAQGLSQRAIARQTGHNRNTVKRWLQQEPEFILVRVVNGILNGFPQKARLLFLLRMDLIQPFDEQQVGHLFDDSQRIREAACPEGVPYFVDLGF